MWLKVVVSTFVLMTASGRHPNNSTRDEELDFKELVGGLSDQGQAALVNPEYDAYIKNFTAANPPTRPYEQFQPSSLLRARNWKREDIDKRMDGEDSWQYGNQAFKQYIYRNPGIGQCGKACYILSSIYQRARQDITKYYKFRDFYVNTLEYEIGYLCHVIVAKYMNMLELYEIVYYRVLSPEALKEKKLTMPPRYMFFIYVNIVEYSKSIIHYCNMLHEIEYKYEETGEATHWTDFLDEAETATLASTKERVMHQNQFEKYLEYHKDQYEHTMRENYKRQKELSRGVTYKHPSRTPRPARYWSPKRGGVDYGWSIEHW